MASNKSHTTHAEREVECPWDSGTLGEDESNVEVADASISAEVDEDLGLQLISIRLPKNLIQDLKLVARLNGIGYQPLIRKVLIRFAQSEMRSIAQDSILAAMAEHKVAVEVEPKKRRIA